MQSTHLQFDVQYFPLAKHSQYIFMQRDCRQLQWFASSESSPSSASASSCAVGLIADDAAALEDPLTKERPLRPLRATVRRGEIELTTGALGEHDAAFRRVVGTRNGDDMALASEPACIPECEKNFIFSKRETASSNSVWRAAWAALK